MFEFYDENPPLIQVERLKSKKPFPVLGVVAGVFKAGWMATILILLLGITGMIAVVALPYWVMFWQPAIEKVEQAVQYTKWHEDHKKADPKGYEKALGFYEAQILSNNPKEKDARAAAKYRMWQDKK